MAITLTGTGGLFTRLGKVARAVRVANKFRGDGATVTGVTTDLPTELETIRAQYASNEYDYERALEGMPSAFDAQVNTLGNLVRELRNRAESLLITQADADSPLTQRTVDYALANLIAQMTANGDYVSAPTLSGAATAGTNAGNGTLVVTTKDGSGRNLANQFNETVLVTVTTGNTSGSERLRFVGREMQPDPTAWDWPKGGGSNLSVTAVAPDSSSQEVSNGSFETFTTPNVPDNWTISVGTAGTTVKKNTSIKYSGASALEIDGNGSELTQLRQALTGLDSKTPYAVAFAAKVDVAPAGGVLTVDLFDGSSVINDEAGTANSFTVDLTTLGTSFVFKSGVFRLPEPIPASVYLRLRLSTALSNTTSLLVDHLAMAEMSELYVHGPSVAAISGATAWSLDDTFSLAIGNNYAGKWQSMFNRLFATRDKRLLLPTSGSNLIADSLLD